MIIALTGSVMKMFAVKKVCHNTLSSVTSGVFHTSSPRHPNVNKFELFDAVVDNFHIVKY